MQHIQFKGSSHVQCCLLFIIFYSLTFAGGINGTLARNGLIAYLHPTLHIVEIFFKGLGTNGSSRKCGKNKQTRKKYLYIFSYSASFGIVIVIGVLRRLLVPTPGYIQYSVKCHCHIAEK